MDSLFFKYSFDDEVFESAVRIFSREELRYIEETLKEAHDSASMLAVGDNNVIRAYTGGNTQLLLHMRTDILFLYKVCDIRKGKDETCIMRL